MRIVSAGLRIMGEIYDRTCTDFPIIFPNVTASIRSAGVASSAAGSGAGDGVGADGRGSGEGFV